MEGLRGRGKIDWLTVVIRNKMPALLGNKVTQNKILSVPSTESVELVEFVEPSKQSLHLQDLPAELLLSIADFLPLTSTAALAFTCKLIRYKLGTKSWVKLRELPLIKYDFLTLLRYDLLEKGILDTVLCSDCVMFHLPRTVHERPTSLKMICSPTCGGKARPAYDGAHEQFAAPIRFSNVQMAMQHFFHGQDVSRHLLTLSYTWSDLAFKYPMAGNMLARISSPTATIADASLLIRAHFAINLFTNGNIELFEALKDIAICPHSSIYKWLSEMGKCEICRCCGPGGFNVMCSRIHNAKRVHEKTLYSCHWCDTEAELQFKVCKKKGAKPVDVLFFTAWKDLGQGETHFDERWNKHCNLGQQSDGYKLCRNLGWITDGTDQNVPSVIRGGKDKDYRGGVTERMLRESDNKSVKDRFQAGEKFNATTILDVETRDAILTDVGKRNVAKGGLFKTIKLYAIHAGITLL